MDSKHKGLGSAEISRFFTKNIAKTVLNDLLRAPRAIVTENAVGPPGV